MAGAYPGLSGLVFSHEGNSEAYNEAFDLDALKVKEVKIKLSGKEDWDTRHYLHHKSLSRAVRLYLIEIEMRSLGENWTFPIYSAYTDSAYDDQLIRIDEHRLRVIMICTGCITKKKHLKDGYKHHCGDFCKAEGCIFKGHDMVNAIDGDIYFLLVISLIHCIRSVEAKLYPLHVASS